MLSFSEAFEIFRYNALDLCIRVGSYLHCRWKVLKVCERILKVCVKFVRCVMVFLSVGAVSRCVGEVFKVCEKVSQNLLDLGLVESRESN